MIRTQFNTEEKQSGPISVPTQGNISLSDLPFDQSGSIQKTIPLASYALGQTAVPTASDLMKQTLVKGARGPSHIATQQIAEKANITPQSDSQQVIRQAQTRLDDAIVKAKSSGDKPQASFLVQIAAYVAEISTLLSQWNTQSSHRSEKKKKEYDHLSASQQDNFYSRAGWNLAAAIISSAVTIVTQNEGVGRMADKLLITGDNILVAQAEKPKNELIMIQTELQKLNEASSNNNALRDQALQLLQQVEQWAQRAVS